MIRLNCRKVAPALTFVYVACSLQAWGQHEAESSNVRLVGHSDLQARSAYHPEIKRQTVNGEERWIAYVGHHGGRHLDPLSGEMEYNGTSIIDVTDPENPVYLHHLEATDGTNGAQMARVCNGDELPGGTPGSSYLLRANGGRMPAGGNVSHQIYNVTDPANPVLISVLSDGLTDTHKNFWECGTGIAYLVSGVPGWRVTRMTQVFDLSDPANPVFIRNFGLDGQQPDATGTTPVELHGCISVVDANRIYCGHGTNSNGIVAIIDRDKLINAELVDPVNPTSAELQEPVISQLRLPNFMGAHTSFPILGMTLSEFEKDEVGAERDFVVVVNESLRNECTEEWRQQMYMVDVSDEVHPMPVATFNVPAALGNFCERGGRNGAHASHENPTPIFHKKLVFVTWFNAGMRVVDVRNPFNPTEVGYYIPATSENTANRCIEINGQERCKTAIQSNNLEVDDRGYIYVTDRAGTGMHILDLTGDAREIADYPE